MRTERKVVVVADASQDIGRDGLSYAQEMSNTLPRRFGSSVSGKQAGLLPPKGSPPFLDEIYAVLRGWM